MTANSPVCCIYTVVYGSDRDLAARLLRSYRRNAPAASIVAACLDGPTDMLRRAARLEGIDLIDLSHAHLSASWPGFPYITATVARFVDVPPLLPFADLYLMVDADTVCLRPLPVDALFNQMVEAGQTFAAAPDTSPLSHRYLARYRRILEAFHLTDTLVDPTAAMVNAGVVAWRRADGHESFPVEYTECLRYIREEDAEDALFFLPFPDQAIVNVLAHRHAGGRFRLLEPDWNERRPLRRDGALPGSQGFAMQDVIIWHGRDGCEALYDARYPGAPALS